MSSVFRGSRHSSEADAAADAAVAPVGDLAADHGSEVQDGPSDAELISRVRGGDNDAYGLLFERHVDAANRLARSLTGGAGSASGSADCDDLVSEAFVKVLNVLRGGGGPDIAFRAYLLTAVRRLHVDRLRATNRVTATDDLSPYDPGVPFRDTMVAGFESGAAARAFASLPERWQLVLWHLEVEGQKPAAVAPLLGMSPNSVSALAYRAREGLRQAYLDMHTADLVDESCRETHSLLGAYVRKGLSRRDTAKVEKHLDECPKCTAIYLELASVNSELAGVIGPVVLGGAAAAYLSTHAGGGGVLAWLAAWAGKASAATHAVPGGAPAAAGTAAVAGVAATVAVVALHGTHPRPATVEHPVGKPVATAPATTTPSGQAAGQARTPQHRPAVRPSAVPPAVPRTGAPTTSAAALASLPPPLVTTPALHHLPTRAPHPPTAVVPTRAPVRTPTRTPRPTPTPQPTPRPTPPPSADLSMQVAPTAIGPSAIVSYQVTGLATGRSTEVSITPSVGVVVAQARGCQRLGGGSYSCPITAGETLRLLAVATGRTPGTLTLTVQVPAGTTDPTPGNNSVTVAVG